MLCGPTSGLSEVATSAASVNWTSWPPVMPVYRDTITFRDGWAKPPPSLLVTLAASRPLRPIAAFSLYVSGFVRSPSGRLPLAPKLSPVDCWRVNSPPWPTIAVRTFSMCALSVVEPTRADPPRSAYTWMMAAAAPA